MRQGDTPQDIVEHGVVKQYREDSAQYVDMFTVTAHEESWLWPDLTGEALDMREATKAKKLEFEYCMQTGVCEKVPAEEAKSGGHKVLGVRWTRRRLMALIAPGLWRKK